MEKIAVLLNPSAGKGRSINRKRKIEYCLRKYGLSFDLMVSRSEEHLCHLARQSIGKYQRVVGVGGDTTFKIIVSEFLKSDYKTGSRYVPTLGMIGTGSANDVVRSLGIHNIEDLCKIVREGRTRKMDVGVLYTGGIDKPVWFLGSVSAGLGVDVNRYVESFCQRHPRLGKFNPIGQELAGAMAVRQAFAAGNVPVQAALLHKGSSLDITYSLLTVLNTPFYANGLSLCPDATPFDGILDAVAIHTTSWLNTLTLFLALGRGTHLKRRETTVYSCERFRIETNQKIDFLVDGDIVTGTGPYEISLLSGALPVFTML